MASSNGKNSIEKLIAQGTKEAKSLLTCFKQQTQTSHTPPISPGAKPLSPRPQTPTPRNPNSPKEDTLSPRQRKQLCRLASNAKKSVSQRFEDGTRKSSFKFWKILVLTAVFSSLLSYCIDQFTWAVGIARVHFTTGGGGPRLGLLVAFNCTLACVARLVVRTTVEAEGSGFPEVKAMLFGKVMLNYLTMRVLAVKAIALSLGVGAGLPLGKEGPNVHMAACISRFLGPDFYERTRGRSSASGIHLLLAACAVGVGSSFSAPIGGVVFSLELVMPQVFDYIGYSGCFLSAVTGSICFACYRTWTAGADGLLPLMSSNVLPDEGAMSQYPSGILILDICVGLICGFLGGVWIKMHAKVVGAFKRWRLKQTQASVAASKARGSMSHIRRRGSLYDSLMDDGSKQTKGGGFAGSFRYAANSVRQMATEGVQWRDLFQIIVVCSLNTVLAVNLPLLGGKPQPLLLSTLFNKDLMINEDQWSLEMFGPEITMILCFLMKWTTTILALSLPSPAGVVAPTMIIGGLLGRVISILMPEALVTLLLSTPEGGPISEDVRGAFHARLAIVGSAAFCAAVCRAFAMAITVFEVLALPNAVLPLCSSSLAAIFVANRIALPYFDTNLVGRGLGGISALTHTKRAMEPAFTVMRRIDIRTDALEEYTTLAKMQRLLTESQEDHFPILQNILQTWCDEGVTAVLKGSISRPQLEQLCDRYARQDPEMEMFLLDQDLTRPLDRSSPLVCCVPTHVSPDTHVQDVYLLMKITHEPVIFVTQDNCLQGVINFKALLGHNL